MLSINKRKKMCIFPICAVLLLYPFSMLNVAAENKTFDVSIDTTDGKKLISQYIYGINSTVDLQGITATAIKQGGSRFSTYNWENNFSNAGANNFNTSDNKLVAELNDNSQKKPAMPIEQFINTASANNIPFTITTLPMCGFVAADANGPILDSQIAPSNRWISLYNQKPSALSLTPDLTDGAVYVDEYIEFLIHNFGKAKTSGIKAFMLDSEPEMWNSTHSTVHPEKVSCKEIVDKSTDLAKVVTSLDDGALIIGGGFAGIKSFVSCNGADDWAALNGKYNIFLDYYLSEMKRESSAYGKRLLDVLDIHWYTQNSSDNVESVLECKDYSHAECNAARMQSTRTLWDSTFSENSDVGHDYMQYLPLLPTVQASINTNFSGTKLAISEYNFGGGGDISGGIAQVDALGIFAKQNVYLACLSPMDSDIDYQKSAVNLFTNYDGNGSSFGNISVKATTSDNVMTSVYSAIEKADEKALRVVLTNKNPTAKQTAKISINSGVNYSGGAAFGFNEKSSEIKQLGNIKNVKDNSFQYTLEPLSAVILVLTEDGKLPAVVLPETDISNNPPKTTIGEITSELKTETVKSTDKITSAISPATFETTKVLNSIVEEFPEQKNHEIPLYVKVPIGLMIGLIAAGVIYLFLSDLIVKK